MIQQQLEFEAPSRHFAMLIHFCFYFECEKIDITSTDDGIAVGKTGSVIEQVDIPASNGVIHHIFLPLVHPKLNLTTLCANYTINCNTTDINLN